ncbi:5-oxoprolinase subunit PxpB [Marinicrinis sediminis]|uniref:5-oxoprolinase subunit PxpB n=1 Tax=Marinicrinis sediminis TaxID=1652465 RepID=A0ABW5R859_9BACL
MNPITLDMIPISEQAITVQFYSSTSIPLFPYIQAFLKELRVRPISGMVECIATDEVLTVYYDPAVVQRLHRSSLALSSVSHWMKMQIHERHQLFRMQERISEKGAGSLKIIPVCYGGQYGPDLDVTANHLQMDTSEVIRLHSEREYVVSLIGFAPGFPYLQGMDERIAVPRRAEPRIQVEKGSVGIGGVQTGVYPLTLPGGWQLIGRTPMSLFDPHRDQPSYLQPGDRVRFEPISKVDYERYRE